MTQNSVHHRSHTLKKGGGLSEVLADHAARTRYEQLPPQAVAAAKWSLLDGLGVMLAASGLCVNCRPFIDLALEPCGRKESSVMGTGTRTTAAMAAFANGAMAHALDFEDAHDKALVHPNAPLIPAVAALAESLTTVSGKDFITAMAVGADLVCRLGMALGKNPMDDGWYIPPVLGAFGAAASAGRLLNLDPSQMQDAFALTLCQATCSAQLRFSPHSDVRAVRDAFAAQAGLTAARLALKGVRGFEQVFEGRAGLFQLYARGCYDPQVLTRDLGTRFEGARVSFKPWPACRGTHTYIEAALALQASHGIDPDQIRAVQVRVSPLNRMLCEPRKIKRQPSTGIDAKFSLAFVIATALCYRAVKLHHFEAPALRDERVLLLARKVSHEVLAEPTGQNALTGVVEIRMQNGSLFSKTVTRALGHPEHPMRNRDLEEKFLECAAHARVPLPEKNMYGIIDTIRGLETLPNMTPLFAHLSD